MQSHTVVRQKNMVVRLAGLETKKHYAGEAGSNLPYRPNSKRSRDSSVGIMTDELDPGFNSRQAQDSSLLHGIQTGSGAHPASCPVGPGDYFGLFRYKYRSLPPHKTERLITVFLDVTPCSMVNR
jgi:hypothetical protein